MAAAVCIVSGSTLLRLPSPINHKIYADRQGVDFRLECGPVGPLKNRFYFKLKVLANLVPKYDWVLWIDDDAFFTNLSVDLHAFIRARRPDTLITLADGRVRPGGQWTRINTGVMLVRSCREAVELFERCLATDINVVRQWWDPEQHGMFTASDQDTLLREHLTAPDKGYVDIVPHLELNAREYHFSQQLDEHFVCHFPGLPDKMTAIRKFGHRFGVGPTLVPAQILREHGLDEQGAERLLPAQTRLRDRIRGRLARVAKRLMPR